MAAAEPPEWPYASSFPSTTNTTTAHHGVVQMNLIPGGRMETTQSVQSAVEGAVQTDDDNSIEFLGKRFRLAERVGLMPMLAFAAAAKKGLDSDDMDGLAAMYALVRDVLDRERPLAYDDEGEQVFDPDGSPKYAGKSQWQLFEEHCYEEQADGEEIMEFIGKAMSVISARPRKRREISSGSSPRTSPRSRDASSLRDTIPQAGLTPVRDVGRRDLGR